MHVDEAIRRRNSVRRFLSTSAPTSVVHHILRVAARAPSGNNVQPWKVYVVAGEARQRLCEALIDAATHEPDRHQPEYAYYPTTWVEPYTEALKRYTESGHWARRTLRETAAKAPERPAVVDPADRPDLTGTAAHSLSYRELSAAVDAIATGLLDMGLRKGEIVVVQLPNVWELVTMFPAVSRAGDVLSPMPIQWRANEFQSVKKFIDARFFFGMRDFKGANQLAIAEKNGFVALPIERIAEMARGAADIARLDAIVVDANDILGLCWSTGTEVLSKGCPMSHNNWLFQMNLIPQTAGLHEGDRVLATAPVVNMTGVATWLASLVIGGTTLLHHSLNMPLLLKQLMHDQVHFTLLVPALLNMILKLPNVDQLDFSGVRCIASSSAQRSRWSMGSSSGVEGSKSCMPGGRLKAQRCLPARGMCATSPGGPITFRGGVVRALRGPRAYAVSR